MATIDQNTRDRQLAEIQRIASGLGIGDVTKLTSEEKNALIPQIENMLGKSKRGDISSRIREAGSIATQGKEFVVDPSTGRVSALDVGAGGKPRSGIDELIAMEKLRSQREIDRQKEEEREIKMEKSRLDLEEKRKQSETQDRLRREKELAEGKGEVPKTPPVTPEEAIPTSVPETAQPGAPRAEVPITARPKGEPEPRKVISQDVPPPEFNVVFEEDAKGNITKKRVKNPDFELFQKGREKRATEVISQATKLASGRRISFTNLEKVAGAISDLDRVFADVHRYGEGGSLGAQALFEGAKLIGGETQDQFPNASALPGKKAEVLFNMIPMLTQQGEKPGSVRIMRSVLALLGQTLPELKTGLQAGRKQMAESIRSFYRFARAAELNGLEFDREFSGRDNQTIRSEELSAWIDKVNRAAGRVQMSSEEEDALNNFIENSLENTGELIKERGTSGKIATIGGKPVQVGNIISIEEITE